MQSDLQTAIVQQIQRVTEEGECVVNVDRLELNSKNEQGVSMLAHLERVIKERDAYATCLLEMAHEHESDESSTTTGASSISGELPSRAKFSDVRYEGRTPSPTSIERHVNVELASAKAELRKLRNLTEEKDELVAELRDELEAREADLRKMQQERLELIKDARAAKDYRDEMDCLQHKVTKLERLEAENTKLKEKVTEMDFFKSRITQLKEENDLIHESCTVLEQQLEQSERKASTHLEVETKLADCQTQIKDLQSDLTEERDRIEQLLLENGRLERELNVEQQKSAALERRVESLSEERSAREDFGSLGSQMADDDKKRILELQLENRKLKSKLQNSDENEEIGEMRAKLLRAEIELSQRNEENAMVSRQLQEFEITLAQLTAQYKETCEMYEVVKSERDSAQQSLQEARRNFSEFQADFQKEMKSDLERKIQEFETSTSNKDRLLENAIEEKTELERQFEKLRIEYKHLQMDNEQLVESIQKAEEAVANAEKLRKNVEIDRNTLKDRNELLEQRVDEARVKHLNMENVEKRLEANEQMLNEKQSRLNELNAQKRQMSQKLELEIKKSVRLNDDLVIIKSRYDELVSRLRFLCSTIQSSIGQCTVPSDDDDMALLIDEIIMKSFTFAKREADALRVQHHSQAAELKELKCEIEKLRKSEGHTVPNESGDRIRELSIENRNVKEQVFLLQDRIRDSQVENSAKSVEISSLKREIEEMQRGMASNSKLHTELAKLQVSLKNLQLQEELLRRDNSELQKQLEICEQQKQALKSDLDTMQSVHAALLSDHDRLQSLHDMLTTDYDRAKYDASQLKLKLKSHKSTTEEVTMLRCENERERRYSEELKTMISLEKERHETDIRSLQNDLVTLQQEYDRIRQDNNDLKRMGEKQSEEIRRLHLLEQSHRSTIARLNSNIDDLGRSLQARDLQIAKLQNKIDMLYHLNRTLDEESKVLVRQMDHLLAQNKDLLNKALNDKDSHHAEQKEFQEKLAALRRHKEKLEEKIMEQYRMMDNKKAPKEKQTLVKRAAKALISKSPKKSITTNKTSEKIVSNESTAEESSLYSTDEPPHHGATPAYEGQSTNSSRLHNLICSPYKSNTQKTPKVVNNKAIEAFPRNSTVRLTTSEKRANAFPIRFASLRVRSRSASTNARSAVNTENSLQRQPSTYDNLNAKIHC